MSSWLEEWGHYKSMYFYKEQLQRFWEGWFWVVEAAGRLEHHHDWASCLTQHAITTSTPRLRQTTTPKATHSTKEKGERNHCWVQVLGCDRLIKVIGWIKVTDRKFGVAPAHIEHTHTHTHTHTHAFFDSKIISLKHRGISQLIAEWKRSVLNCTQCALILNILKVYWVTLHFKLSQCYSVLTFTFTFSHFADAFIQSDIQLGYIHLHLYVFPTYIFKYWVLLINYMYLLWLGLR